MKYLGQFGILAGAAFAGELLHALLPLPVPASMYGLVLLFVLLCTGLVRLEWVEETADYLLAVMPLLFIEPSVQLMTAFPLLRGRTAALFAVCFLSWAAAAGAAGHAAQAVIRRRRKRREKRAEEEGGIGA